MINALEYITTELKKTLENIICYGFHYIISQNIYYYFKAHENK